VTTPQPVGELNPTLPPTLADLVGQMLEKDPARRPSSALEVREALTAIAASEASCTGMRPRSPTQTGTQSASAVASKLPAPRRRLPRWLVPVAGLAGGIL